MIAADGKGVAVTTEDEHMQVRPAQRNAAGKGKGAPVNVMRTVSLHEVGEAAGAANAGDGGDLFVPQLALLDQLEVKREHGEVAAAGAPRRVIGGNFFFRETFAFSIGDGGNRHAGDVASGARQRSKGNGQVVHGGRNLSCRHQKVIRICRWPASGPFRGSLSLSR